MILSDLSIIIMQRVWQAISGFATLLFIFTFLNLNEQGWYYSFLSASSFYTLFEMGLYSILVTISASHWRDLRWGPRGSIMGETGHFFADVIHHSWLTYLKMAAGFSLVVVVAGFVFFHSGSKFGMISDPNWPMIWVFLVIATALQMLIMPFLSIVEGAGRMAEAYGVRLIQSVVGSLICWLCLSQGLGLWATIAVPMAGFGAGALWLATKRPATLLMAFNQHGSAFQWRDSVWPLQWKFALTWWSAFCLTQIYTPFIFAWYGAEAAGQFGLSLTIAHMVGIIVQSWMARRAPAMVRAVQDKDWSQLDQLFKSGFFSMMVLFLIAIGVLAGAHLLLERTAYAHRILDLKPFIVLFFAVFVYYIVGALALQLRSFLREPLMGVMLASAALTFVVALPVLQLYGVAMMVNAICAVQMLFNLPLSCVIWYRCQRQWRVKADGPAQ